VPSLTKGRHNNNTNTNNDNNNNKAKCMPGGTLRVLAGKKCGNMATYDFSYANSGNLSIFLNLRKYGKMLRNCGVFPSNISFRNKMGIHVAEYLEQRYEVPEK
jgi:hypothetical protein